MGVKQEDKTRLTCTEKGDLEEFWTHLAGRASCTIELSSDWSNPHSHPVNDDRLVINCRHFITRRCFVNYIFFHTSMISATVIFQI